MTLFITIYGCCRFLSLTSRNSSRKKAASQRTSKELFTRPKHSQMTPNSPNTVSISMSFLWLFHYSEARWSVRTLGQDSPITRFSSRNSVIWVSTTTLASATTTADAIRKSLHDVWWCSRTNGNGWWTRRWPLCWPLEHDVNDAWRCRWCRWCRSRTAT